MTRLLRTCLLALFALALPASASALPLVTVQGHELRANGANFRSVGFNYAPAPHKIAYVLDPTPANRATLVHDFQVAKAAKSNTLRVYMHLFDVVERDANGTLRARQDRLANYVEVLRLADSMGLYLDVTGNLTWVRSQTPAWYDAMSNAERWTVQAFFWEQVARVSAPFDSVLCYELTSEPSITSSTTAPWTGGTLGGFDFVPAVAKGVTPGTERAQARAWATAMRDAVRRYDTRHLVTIGLLPIKDWAFGPENMHDLLDFLIVHEYPQGSGTGGQPNMAAVNTSLDIVKAFAAWGKPVVLGETTAFTADLPTQAWFMVLAQRYLAGTYNFFDGRSVAEIPTNGTIYDALKRATVQQHVDLAPYFLAATQLPQAYPVYRLANGNGRQLSTLNPWEADSLKRAGWKSLGTNGYAFPRQRFGTVPLYRLAKGRTGDHLFTTSAAEVQRATTREGYRSEGVAGYAYATPTPNTVPLYRLYNTRTRNHRYTTSASERQALARQKQWKSEGTVAYVRTGE